MNLAILLWRRKAFDEAEYHFKEALRQQPDFMLARQNYAAMLREMGRAK